MGQKLGHSAAKWWIHIGSKGLQGRVKMGLSLPKRNSGSILVQTRSNKRIVSLKQTATDKKKSKTCFITWSNSFQNSFTTIVLLLLFALWLYWLTRPVRAVTARSRSCIIPIQVFWNEKSLSLKHFLVATKSITFPMAPSRYNVLPHYANNNRMRYLRADASFKRFVTLKPCVGERGNVNANERWMASVGKA